MNGRDTEPRGTSYPSDRRGCQPCGHMGSNCTINMAVMKRHICIINVYQMSMKQ